MKKDSLNSWVKSGTPWIWMNAGAVSIAVIMTLGLLAIIAVRGLAHFWPADVIVADYSMPGAEMRVLAGEVDHRDVVLTHREREAHQRQAAQTKAALEARVARLEEREKATAAELQSKTSELLAAQKAVQAAEAAIAREEVFGPVLAVLPFETEEEAVALLVNGFVRDVLQELPMEFAVEAQKLVAISLEGSVG